MAQSQQQLDGWIADLRAASASPAVPAREYRYGTDEQHRADLRLPDGEPPYPVVVVIHGGAFRAHFDRTIMEPVAIDLTRRGYATWNIEFRRTDCGGGPSTTTDDIARAVAHLAVLDAPLDLERTVVLGHSSGGYLALWAAALPVVHRVVALAAVCDLRLIATDPQTPYARFAGGMPDEVPDAYDALDLTRRFPSHAAIEMLCGLDDGALRLRENREFFAAATARGEAVSYQELADTEHFSFMDPSTGAWRASVEAIQRLLG